MDLQYHIYKFQQAWIGTKHVNFGNIYINFSKHVKSTNMHIGGNKFQQGFILDQVANKFQQSCNFQQHLRY